MYKLKICTKKKKIPFQNLKINQKEKIIVGLKNLVFALGTIKTLTYSTENPNSSSKNPNSGSSSAFSLKFSMISLLLFFLF